MFATSVLSSVRSAGAAALRFSVSGAVIWLASLPTASLLAAQEQHGAAAGGGLFGVNWAGLMFWTWLIFIALLLVLRKWAWGPILGALEARERRIQEALDTAAHDRDEANRVLEEHRRLLVESREQAQHILADTRTAAARLRAEMLEEARGEKERLVGRARDEIQHERDQALATLRREAVDLSIAAAGRVLHKNLDTQENRRLVTEYLDSLATEDRRAGAD
jgi:F-type H+-transporting ATPase subunit b